MSSLRIREHEDMFIDIDESKEDNVFLLLIIKLVLNCLYVLTYIDTPEELKQNTLSKCFLLYIILTWGSNLCLRYDMYTNFRNGRMYQYKICLLLRSMCLCIGCYIWYEIPLFGKGCDIYDDRNICSCLKFISFHNILLLLWIFSHIGYSVIISSWKNHQYRIQLNNFKKHYHVSDVIGSGMIYCCICLEFVKDTLVRLDCEHKFHVKCIFEWFKYHRSCPYCREMIKN